MLFNSFEFIFVFLPAAVLGWHLLRGAGQQRAAMDWLIACSLAFYAWGNAAYLPVLLGSMLFNYAVARWMDRRQWRLAFGIAANIALLAYFKVQGPLPLGVSFWTLVQVMYLVDCYEGMVKPSSLREHALFATFFPVVSMGPMLRAKDTLAQLRDPAARFSVDALAPAILLFCFGLFKKVVIADSFARLADAGYSAPAALSLVEGWITSLSYCLQLYYDFSGYSDMAMAVALALGLRIPANFNNPYQARSIVDFWRRWHITLSNFITTYLYTPMLRALGKVTFAKAMLATFVAMVIAGIWHGSSWGYVVFGALHGLGLVVNQYRKKAKHRKLPDALAWALTLAYVNVAFVFFRAPSLPDAVLVLRSMADLRAPGGLQTIAQSMGVSMKEIGLPLLLGVGLVFSKRTSQQAAAEFTPSLRNLSWASAALLASLFYLNSNMAKQFLYFDF